jgi:hypothetical protein
MYIPSFNEQLHWYNNKVIKYPVIHTKLTEVKFETPVYNRATFLLNSFYNSLNKDNIKSESKCLTLLKNAGQNVDVDLMNVENFEKKRVYQEEIDSYMDFYSNSDSESDSEFEDFFSLKSNDNLINEYTILHD